MKYFLLACFVIFNAIALFSFAWDKFQAKRNGQRTPETKLLIASVVGPLGSVIGMFLFRHKTQKTSFRIRHAIALVASVILHIGGLYFLYFRS